MTHESNNLGNGKKLIVLFLTYCNSTWTWVIQYMSYILITSQIDGEATFEVPLSFLQRLTRNIEYETFLVHANVTEGITGITLEGEADMRYYGNPYKLEFFPNMPDNFKPGFGPYPVYVCYVKDTFYFYVFVKMMIKKFKKQQ